MPRRPKPPPPVIPCAVSSSTDVHTATAVLVARCPGRGTDRHVHVRPVCDDDDPAIRSILSTCPSCQRPTTIKTTAL